MEPDLHSHYQRNLPHRLPPGHTVFITYRLFGTLPWHIRQLLEEEDLRTFLQNHPGADPARRKNNFARYDTWLDHDQTQAQWLRKPDVAAVVRESLLHFDGRAYQLQAFCIMPNHVHLVVTLAAAPDKPFYRVLQAQKRFSATQANRLLQRTGPFWQRESYDHLIRDEPEFGRVIAYTLNNPVKAGLVPDWKDWPHSYLAEL